MENEPIAQQHQELIDKWGRDIEADWQERFGAETAGHLGTALIIICQVKEAQSKARFERAKLVEQTSEAIVNSRDGC